MRKAAVILGLAAGTGLVPVVAVYFSPRLMFLLLVGTLILILIAGLLTVAVLISLVTSGAKRLGPIGLAWAWAAASVTLVLAGQAGLHLLEVRRTDAVKSSCQPLIAELDEHRRTHGSYPPRSWASDSLPQGVEYWPHEDPEAPAVCSSYQLFIADRYIVFMPSGWVYGSYGGRWRHWYD